MRGVHRRRRVAAMLAAAALVATACGDGGNGGTDPDGTDPDGEVTLVFGTSADPIVLDGVLVSDGESLRAIDQMFEGLVGLAHGSTEIEPLLATDWSVSDDGLDWTFTLRDDVTFHDGEPFNADAVCFNFERWYNFTGSLQSPDATYYWQSNFGGFATQDLESAPEDSLYGGCEATGDHEVVLSITRPSGTFLSALALTNFTFASPAALEEYNADNAEVGEDGVFRATGTYGTEHPTGTGPFMFESWTRGERLVMVRNPNYWGEFPGNIDRLIFRPIAEGAARLQALQTGEIDGYDLVSPEDFPTIDGDADLDLLRRPAFNIGYVGISQGIEPLDDIEVRRAIAHALDRQGVVDGFYAGQGVVAHEFLPPELFGYAGDVTQFDYDPEAARQILEDAGYDLPLSITFGFPTDVTRPYMPNPQANAEAFAADLEAAGFDVDLQSAPWNPDYLGVALNGGYGLYLLGWTGDIGDPDNFLGTFFKRPSPEWGFDNQEIFSLLEAAELETDIDVRTGMYQEASRLIADFIPGVPYVHTEPALVFRTNITGYTPSPVSLEPFSLVTVN
jgi:peptide/nickel transport system substrate-binding protein